MRAIVFLAFFLAVAAASASAVKYEPNWASLDQRPIPEWFDDAKFGIFIHWGVYSVPSWGPHDDYAEWYWNRLNEPNSPTQHFHNATYGPDFKYEQFAPMFQAKMFDPDAWAQLFKKAGARYVVPTSKHHEGFTLWKSPQSWNWNSVDIGPHRDLLFDIMNATRSYDMHASLYYSLYEWYHPLYLSEDPSKYVHEVMLPQMRDLVTNYKPDYIFTDGAWDHTSDFWNSPEFIAWVYNESPVKDTIVLNDRWGSDTPNKHGGIFTPEYQKTVYLDHKWEESQGIDFHSYGYNRNTDITRYFDAEELLHLLIRCVANGGNLLLDVGPTHDGRIPNVMQERLLEMGQWLDVNGEAIYNTRYWRVQQEGDIDNTTLRYTRSKDNSTVYAISLVWPDSKFLDIPSPITNTATTVTLLGHGPVDFVPLPTNGLKVVVPPLNANHMPCKHAYVFKLTNVK